MKFKTGLRITHAIYLSVILLLLAVALYPIISHAWFPKKEIPQAVEVVVEKTLNSEIDRLSIKYNVASSTVRAVAKCESSMYGSATNKNRLPDGSVWSTDYGPLQINDYFHKDTMAKMGLDIYDSFESLEYGVMLMSKQGLGPWKASKTCWISKI